MLLDQVVLLLIAFFFSLGRAAIIGSSCLAILREYMSVGHSHSKRNTKKEEENLLLR